MQLEVGGDYGGGELGVRGGARAGAPDRGGDVVELLAVLVGDDGAGGGAGVRCYLHRVVSRRGKKERMVWG